MAYELVFRWPTGERALRLDGPIVVGRDPDCDLSVDSVRVSRRHAEFIPTPRGVSVRDLGSRNGILVNGSRVDEALVGPADRVLLGDVAVMVGGRPGIEDARQPVAPAPGPGSPPATAVPPEPCGAPGTPSAAAPGFRAPAMQTPPGPADKTTILPRGGLATPSVAAAAPAAVTAKTTAARTAGRRFGLGARLFAGALLVSVCTFTATALPIVKARNEAIRSASLARAMTIVRAMGVANGVALAAGQTLGVGVQDAAAEPGVREVLLLSPDGRVLAPANRLSDRVSKLPAFGDISDLQGVQTAEIGAEIQAAAVIEAGGRRVGLAWVRLDPTYAAASAPVGVYLMAALFTGLALAALTAHLTRKAIRARVAAFATDVDLAASGQLETITEAFGVPQLAASVNFVIGRLRMQPAPGTPIVALPQAPLPSPVLPSREGHLILDSAFVVQEVDPAAAELLRTTPAQLLGQHVLAAIPEQSLVTALIDTIADTATVGKSPRRVVGSSGMPALELQADRTAPDGPVRVTIRRLG